MSGNPIAVVITGKAANAFPITLVNNAIPMVYVATTMSGVFNGIHR